MRKIFFLIIAVVYLYAKPSQDIIPISLKAKNFFEIIQPIDFAYKDNVYRIFIAKSKSKAKNYKVLYTLDGNAFFSRFLNAFKTKPKYPLLIVALGYKGDAAFHMKERRKDYTPKVLGEEFKDGGNSEEFLAFFQDILLPFIEKQYPINKDFKGLFGHSFGGLFTLFALDKNTDLTHFFINSPSLWWGQGSFLPSNFALKSCPKVFITQGELEQNNFLVNRMKISKITPKELAERIAKESSCEVGFKLFEKQTHGSVIEKDIQFALENF
ncbi:alpha/beta hydrolase-fold protein [Campylobacter sp. MIT 21-1685]|uniref:alpha/beta hydrolase n=1 Tax=unclassified Campylobacter TaxID=2593542 RepID=UPI00224A586A|nr:MULTISPECIES: alpha/beta hydrolase-fold protein [unclassified Campylobacter]MCX2683151.1 alpha/beta hydrolase-fold protein [Campylobacter sp. MIT 21-1684]MCX2751390.1 alpha/beta hydrolase-fold protein [Campylobacter sp. MIT 21-1682]MCX2807589.1 alpha/beta hydrolase-fold protein [Campylobacter sp. MIT 21-1685]